MFAVNAQLTASVTALSGSAVSEPSRGCVSFLQVVVFGERHRRAVLYRKEEVELS